MKVNLRTLHGPWDFGIALDKHTLSSTYIGDNEYGRAQFDTTRSEVGEALFQLKYRSDKSQAPALAKQIAETIAAHFDKVELIVPMPASTVRAWQPVNLIADELGAMLGVPVFSTLLEKAGGGAALKNLTTKDEKLEALDGRFSLNEAITNEGHWNALLLDDLFDTGASMEAATMTLRKYKKLSRIYALAISWK